jgi:hypothetical protein
VWSPPLYLEVLIAKDLAFCLEEPAYGKPGKSRALNENIVNESLRIRGPTRVVEAVGAVGTHEASLVPQLTLSAASESMNVKRSAREMPSLTRAKQPFALPITLCLHRTQRPEN